MQHEIRKVKKVTKKYTTVNGTKKESISMKIDLTNGTLFDENDNVAIISIDDFNKLSNESNDIIIKLKKETSDKDKTIDANNGSIAKLKQELQDKLNLINDLSKEIKSNKKTIADYESNIHDKDKEIESLKTIISDKNNIIDSCSAKIDLLNTSLSISKDDLIEKDSKINDLKTEIAVFNAIDISELKEKAKELDSLKNELIETNIRLNSKSNFVSLLQNQIMEYIQLVNYYKEKLTASENKGIIDYILHKDVTANITAPSLYLIDESGNIKNDDDNIVEIESGKQTKK